MGIVSAVTTALTEFLTACASAIPEAIQNLLFTTGADGETVLSTGGTTIMVLFGIGCAISLMWVVMGLVVRK